MDQFSGSRQPPQQRGTLRTRRQVPLLHSTYFSLDLPCFKLESLIVVSDESAGFQKTCLNAISTLVIRKVVCFSPAGRVAHGRDASAQHCRVTNRLRG